MRITSRLWPALSEAEERAYDLERTTQNLERGTWGLGVALAINLVHLALFRGGGGEAGDAVERWRTLIFDAHAAMVPLGVVGLLVARWAQRSGNARARAAVPAVATVVYLLFGAFAASADQLVTSSVTPFVLVTVAMALLQRLRPGMALFAQAVSLVAFAAGMEHFQANASVRLTNLSNGVTMSLLGLLLSVTFTVYERRDFAQRRTILRQTAELEAAFASSRQLAERAEAASRAKSTFLATMSHEIRTPMNGVLGVAELLSTSRLTPEQQAQVRTIGEAGQALLAVLNDVLDFSKLEAGQLHLEAAPFDLRELVLGVQQLFAARAAEKGLTLEARWAPGMPGRFRGDAGRVRQVLSNLVGNAVKFTERGTVRVELEAEVAGGRGQLELRVVDTGIGLSAEQQGRLFLPFSQADASTTRRFGGTGLGLAISRRLVEAMGGTIGAVSAPGEGSTFWVRLALPTSEEVPVPASPPTSGQRRFRGRVLVAEDNPVNMLVARQMLVRLGLQVVEATDGQQALELLESTPVHLIFTDLHMPLVDGYQLTRTLRARGVSTPVVAVTANVMAEDKELGEAAGLDDALAKPFSLADLERVLARWLPADARAA